MQVPFLVVGQGICGTLVSWYLYQRGIDFLVMDAPVAPKASLVARGLINPVTGKRLADSWLYPTLLAEALDTYQAVGSLLGQSLLSETSLLQCHKDEEAVRLFAKKAAQDNPYLDEANVPYWEQWLRLDYGAGLITPCWLVQGKTLIASWRQHLQSTNRLLEQQFSPAECTLTGNGLKIGAIQADYVICCEGAMGAENPWFAALPWAIDKGEAAWVRIPDLPATHLYHCGLKIIPVADDIFWVGSSFEWEYPDLNPSETYRHTLRRTLNHWIKLPYQILDVQAAARPATVDRRPICGVHPLYPQVAMVGGTGTKGYLQAPYTAKCLIDHLLDGKDIPADISMQRFQRALTRN